MEYVYPIFGLILAVIGILVTYHIAYKQGTFRRPEITLTLSQPTLQKVTKAPPAFTEIRRIGNLKYPESYPSHVYPYIVKMPLLVMFGSVNPGRASLLYLLFTIINFKGQSVSDVTVNIDLPEFLMPNRLIDIEKPQGLNVKRSIDPRTKRGMIEYELNLKPYDCQIIPEPLLVDSAQVIRTENISQPYNSLRSRIHSIRCVIRTGGFVREDHFNLALIEAGSYLVLEKLSLAIGEPLIDEHIENLKKSFLVKLLRLPYGGRTLLCVQPDYRQSRQGVMEHKFGQEDDNSVSRVLGIIKS